MTIIANYIPFGKKDIGKKSPRAGLLRGLYAVLPIFKRFLRLTDHPPQWKMFTMMTTAGKENR